MTRSSDHGPASVRAAALGLAALALLASGCRSSTPLPAPVVLAVTPASAERGSVVEVTLTGQRFYARAEVDLENGPTRLHDTFTASLGATALVSVRRVDETHLTAVVPGTLAEGTYDLSVEGPYGAANLPRAFTVTPREAPGLTATLTVPAEAGVDQEFAIVLAVENPGTVAVPSVVPGPLTFGGAGAVRVQPTSHAPVDLAGGASTEFRWTAFGASAGAVDLGASVLGQAGASLATASASMVVRGSASLLGTASAAPDTVSVGQAFLGVLGVSNPAGTAALGVSASVEVVPAGAAAVSSSPAAQDVAANGQAAFAFSLVAAQPGLLSIVFRAQGADPSGSPLFLNPVSAAVLVQRPPELSGAATALPAGPTLGQPITLTLTATNSGEADALAVTPSAVSLSGTGAATLASSPAPQDVPAGASRDFTWTYTASGPGSVSFQVGATGSDANDPLSRATLAPVTAGPVVIAPPRLEVSLDASPAALNVGQDIAVRLTVRNSGTVAANAVAPLLSARGTGSAALSAGPSPAQADLAPSATQVFDWTWRAATAGTVSFDASAAGTDAVSGTPVASGPATAGPIVVGRRAQLSGRLVAPAYVASGQAFDVQLDLSNSGDAAAQAGAPGAISFGGSATAGVASGPTPPTVDVPAGGTASLLWTIQPATEGSLTLTVGAQGVDEKDLLPVTLAPVGASVAVGVHASLTAALLAPSLVAPGASFSLTLTVTNGGSADASAVTPTAVTLTGTGGVTATSGPTPAQADVAAGASADFVWTFSTSAAGLVDLEASAAGTEVASGLPVSSSIARAPLEIAEVQRLFADPFGDGTSASFLFGYRGKVYVGPRQDGSGAVRFEADGSAPESVTFALERDVAAPSVSSNPSSAPYPGFGAPGCARNTGACGPDNESGRGLFASVPLFGDEWLFGAGAASGADRLHHVYLAHDVGPAHAFPYVDLSAALEDQTFTVSAVHVLRDRLYLGLPDTSADRPFLVALLQTPTAPGLDAVLDTDVLHLDGGALPEIGAHSGNNAPVQLVDTMIDFNDRLYLFNNGGCARSTVATPRAAGVAPADWSGCTSTSPDWTRKTSRTTAKTSGLEPADKTAPQAAVWSGRLFALRNTTTGPQLWACNPTLRADGIACDPKKDWSLVAKNTSGDQRLSQFSDPSNASATLLVATPTHLYVGFDSPAGIALFRTANANPGPASDFVGAGGCAAASAGCQPFGGRGLGDPDAKKIFGAVSLSYGGRGYLYVAAGDGVGPLRVFRLDE